MDSRDRAQNIQVMIILQLGFGHSILLWILTEPFRPIPTRSAELQVRQIGTHSNVDGAVPNSTGSFKPYCISLIIDSLAETHTSS